MMISPRTKGVRSAFSPLTFQLSIILSILFLGCCEENPRKLEYIKSTKDVRKYGQDMIVVRAEFQMRDQVTFVAQSGIDIWNVNQDEGYFTAAIHGRREARVLLRNNLTVAIDVEETNFVKEAPTKSKMAAAIMSSSIGRENIGQIKATGSQGRKLGNSFIEYQGIPGYSCYHTVEETYEQAARLAEDYPDLVEWVDVGDSWEKTNDSTKGYDIFVLKLTQSNIQPTDGENKPKLFLSCAIHAREYTTAEFCLRFGMHLLDGYVSGNDADSTWILDHHEVHLMLITNPDGRKKAEEGTFWRKNTNNKNGCSNSQKIGVDLNRNFAYKWKCCSGSSSDACASTYRGSSAASEPEIQALQNYVADIFPDQRQNDNNLNSPTNKHATGIAIDVHSYGQAIVWPWGHIKKEAPEHIELQTLGRKMGYFGSYKPEQGSTSYQADGVSDDHYYGTLGVAAYTLELGTEFFEKCDYFESTLLSDNIPALVYAAKVARTPYLTPAGPEVHGVSVSYLSSLVREDEFITVTADVDDTRYNNVRGVEPSQNIVSCNYYIDIPPWMDGAIAIPMSALDGNFDSTSETVQASIDTSTFSAGTRYTIFVQATDDDGNVGAVSAVFFEKKKIQKIEGTIFSGATGQGGPLQDATVTIGTYSTQTDASGKYSFQIPEGSYDLTIQAPSHISFTLNDVDIATSSSTMKRDFNLVAVSDCTVNIDFESGASGWVNDEGASTCKTGTFVVGRPSKVTYRGVTTQVDGDHTTGNGKAFYTSPNSRTGTDDVDKGVCVATSEEYTIAVDSFVSIWYFYGEVVARNDVEDFFYLEMSTNKGASWIPFVHYNDETVNARWSEATTTVSAGTVSFRIRVSDGKNAGDLIEAGIDDIAICPFPKEVAAPKSQIPEEVAVAESKSIPSFDTSQLPLILLP
mmetsp:Transcript_23126/g.33569  ORF Transcript_23126/g.33569 Transcript_23126/m.33569 type:complete len:915 (+) Transcript_23126:195-2939(+)